MARIISVIVLLGLGWAVGLVLFIANLPEPGAAPMVNVTEGARENGSESGIVVFTGPGGPRVASAMNLLNEGAGARLLISGVNPEISRTRLSELWPGAPEDFDCCVDLGWEAQTTTGNAAELRQWATAHGFEDLILVTSEYHMPRALLEARASLPALSVEPYSVASGYLNDKGRPASWADWRTLAREYSKFLAVRVKTLLP